MHNGKDYAFNWGEMPRKQWRQCIYIDIDNMGAVFSRQYPGSNENNAEIARSMIGERFSVLYGVPNNRKTKSVDIDDMFADTDDYFYCDVKKCSTYGVAMRMESGNYPEAMEVTSNDKTFCAGCGTFDIWENDFLLCEDCNITRECAYCGNQIVDDEFYEHNDNTVCEICWNNEFAPCDICDSYEYTGDLTECNNQHYCFTCRGDHLSRCYQCFTWVPDEEITTVGSRDLCERCRDYFCYPCDNCGRYFMTAVRPTHVTLCESCREEERTDEAC